MADQGNVGAVDLHGLCPGALGHGPFGFGWDDAVLLGDQVPAGDGLPGGHSGRGDECREGSGALQSGHAFGDSPGQVLGEEPGEVGRVDVRIGVSVGRSRERADDQGRCLNIVYSNPGKITKGGFFPAGVNVAVRTSS